MRFSSVLGRLFNRKGQPPKPRQTHSGSTPVHLSPAEKARQEESRQAAASHHGILNEEFARTLETADEGWKFPESQDEPLDYLGNLEPLGLSSEERQVVREWTRELIADRGERAVWNSRLRLKLELRYLATEAGLRGGIGRFPGEVE